MAGLGGYAGNILQVNLSDRIVASQTLSPVIMRQFLGGTGINARLAWDLIKPGIDPFSPNNTLILGVGPFVGTLVPGSAKGNIIAKSPVSGLMGTSGSGHLGMLKFAGYDHLVITGKADKPVYLRIFNDRVEMRDAGHIWGKDLWEATEVLWQELGPDYVVACIGPAGENLVRDAGVIVNKYSAFARTGMGAVMGAKNLKAIALCGTGDVKVADPSRFAEALERFYREFMTHPNLKEWRLYGTLISLEPFARLGLYPHRNFQEAASREDVLRAFDLQVFLQNIKAGDVACMSCPIGCKHFLRIREGKYRGLALSISCANSVIQSFGTFCAIDDWQEIFKCAEMCARLGLDFFSTGNLIAWVMELYQRGIIDQKDTEGLVLDWGSARAVQELIQKIAYKEGIGKILAEGLLYAPQLLGRNSQEYAVQMKGLGFVLDPRARLSTETFSQMTNVKGHTSNVSITMLRRTPEQLRRYCRKIKVPENRVEGMLTGPDGFNPARLNKWAEDYTSLLECLGVCQFPLFQRFDLSVWAELYSSLTGIEATPQELMKAVERTWDMKKAFNAREGASRDDDQLPRRLVTESLRIGNEVLSPVDKEYAENLLSEYYQERNWDTQSGVVKEERLRELGLIG